MPDPQNPIQELVITARRNQILEMRNSFECLREIDIPTDSLLDRPKFLEAEFVAANISKSF